MAFIDTLRNLGVIAVIRGQSKEHAVSLSRALIDGGVKGIELTYSTPDCCAAIKEVVGWGETGVGVGVGTVRTVTQLHEAVEAGATYAVSPHFSQAICDAAIAAECPYLPGCITPTEVVNAWEAGASCIKLFPGSLVGPAYAKALAGPLPDIPLMPTGGVSIGNMAEWFDAGVVAVGMGGNLAKGEPASVKAAAEETMATWRGLKG